MQHRVVLFFAFAAFAAACDSSTSTPPDPCAAQGISAASRFESGGDGHADPSGAKAAGQARAGRIKDAALVRQPANARHAVRVGDFMLANDKIVVYIEDKGDSDGYNPFGGEILAIDVVAADGKAAGLSQYGETLWGLSRQTVKPDSVSVIADGSDGKAAIVRVSGAFTNIPFMDTFEALSPDEFNFPAAVDYVLEPGAEKLLVRLSIMNPTDQAVDLSTNQNFGFFHGSRGQAFTPTQGFAPPSGTMPWIAWDAGDSAFAWRTLPAPIRAVIGISGFQLFQSKGLSVEACAQHTLDYVEVIPAAQGIDALRTVIARDEGTTLRPIAGTVVDGQGRPAAGALVHAQTMEGKYVTRAPVGSDGRFLLHAPMEAVTLQPTLAGLILPAPVMHAPGDADASLAFPASGTIVVDATEAGTGRALPVRVQVIPKMPVEELPEAYGVERPARGRLYQEYATSGHATLEVPPGEHEVIVSHGYEWELHRETVNVASGATVTVTADLVHSVDTTGVMCADFHIHSWYSADSSDPVHLKVRSAVADGLDIAVSSEHEYIIDFQPIVEELGLADWTFGMPSEEFTTFTWGHFGIVPIQPRASQVNNGAIAWVGMKPPEVFQRIAELPEQPVLIVNHPTGGSAFAAYFTAAKLDRATGTGDPELWSDQFGAVEVFNESDFESNRDESVADWFALLETGKKVWATGSSDSHHLRGTQVGYPRTCMPFGHDNPKQLTAEAVRDALRAGKATVAGGLYLTVEGPGGVGPGGTIAGAGPGPVELKVLVQAPSWLSAQSLEVIVDGQTKETQQLQESMGAGPARRYEALVTVQPGKWVVLHAKGGELAPLNPGKRAFAVSNPIFF